MKVKEESEKVGLKLNTQKTKTMAFSPISSWQIDGEAIVRTRHETMDWFQTGKGVRQSCICHPAHLTYMQNEK